LTCVIGTSRWICADRRITSDSGERCPNERKVWRNEYLIVAGAGLAVRLHKVRALVAAGARDPISLIEAVGDDSHTLCLTADGRLCEVSEGAVYWQRGDVPLRCIGTGGDLARGYLEGRAQTEASARAAQRLVARLRADCGGGVDFESWTR
jgi:hypothetical protein